MIGEPSTWQRSWPALLLAVVTLIAASVIEGCATIATVATGVWSFAKVLAAAAALILVVAWLVVCALAAVDEVRCARERRKAGRRAFDR